MPLPILFLTILFVLLHLQIHNILTLTEEHIIDFIIFITFYNWEGLTENTGGENDFNLNSNFSENKPLYLK